MQRVQHSFEKTFMRISTGHAHAGGGQGHAGWFLFFSSFSSCHRKSRRRGRHRQTRQEGGSSAQQRGSSACLVTARRGMSSFGRVRSCAVGHRGPGHAGPRPAPAVPVPSAPPSTHSISIHSSRNGQLLAKMGSCCYSAVEPWPAVLSRRARGP